MNSPLITSSDLPHRHPWLSEPPALGTSILRSNLRHNSILMLSRMPRTEPTQPGVPSVATQITPLTLEPGKCFFLFSSKLRLDTLIRV